MVAVNCKREGPHPGHVFILNGAMLTCAGVGEQSPAPSADEDWGAVLMGASNALVEELAAAKRANTILASMINDAPKQLKAICEAEPSLTPRLTSSIVTRFSDWARAQAAQL